MYQPTQSSHDLAALEPSIWVFPKIWENFQIIHFNRVWNHYFHHPFWGVLHPYFWKHPYFWISTLWLRPTMFLPKMVLIKTTEVSRKFFQISEVSRWLGERTFELGRGSWGGEKMRKNGWYKRSFFLEMRCCWSSIMVVCADIVRLLDMIWSYVLFQGAFKLIISLILIVLYHQQISWMIVWSFLGKDPNRFPGKQQHKPSTKKTSQHEVTDPSICTD